MIDRSLASAGAAAALALVLALAASGQESPRTAAPARPTAADDPAVARVDGKAIRRSELEQRRDRAISGYRQDTGREVPAAFREFFLRAALEEAIRERLIAAEGRARGIRVSDADAEAVLKDDPSFRSAGRFDAAKFAAYRQGNPKSFATVREEARDFLAFQRRARELERELDPDPATLDRLVARRTAKARVRSVLVSETQFDGRTDPTDAQVRETYDRNRASFVPPGRVAFSTITVPGLEEGRVTAPGLARARRAADALLAEILGGTPFDSAAKRPGVLRGSGTWGQGQESGLFAGEPAWAESAFASPPGRVLPRAFETLDGVTLVRVERGTPRTARELAEVADDVRARWRAEHAAARDRDAARRFYDAHPDSFRVPTRVVRWAVVERARIPVKEPKEDVLRAWFETRRNGFTRLDPAGGGIRMLSFEEARAEVRERWMEERREAEARALADRTATGWARGRGDPGRAAGLVAGGPATLVAGGTVPADLRPDLADTLRAWDTAPRAIVVADPAGYAVVALLKAGDRERPPFEVVEAQARAAVERARLAEEKAAARAWFERNRGRYVTGTGYAIVYANSPPPPSARVDVPAGAIEREYRTNLAAYTPPAEVRVRHILFSTETRAASEAVALARAARARLARGEDFAELARELSEDRSTKAQGGDLGFLQAGRTVPEFERAMLALTEKAPLSGPVTTPYGVHLLQRVERRGGTPESLPAVRGRIALKLVAQYADTLSRETAETLRRDARDRASLLRLAEERGLPTANARWHEGFPLTGAAMIDALRADAAAAEPGGLLPGVYRYLDQGYVVAALDSVLPSRPLSFEEASERVLADWRRETRLEAARARAAEVERALAAGRPWREVTETLGGRSEPVLLGAGEPLPGFGALPEVDSLLFGPTPIPAGGRGRIETPRGTLIVEVTERLEADAETRARERETVRRAVLARRVWEHVEALRARARIQVLRPELAERPPAPPAI